MSAPDLDDRLDRFARGDLSAREARDLAQASLDDRELFEEISSIALAKSAANMKARAPARRRMLIAWPIAAAAAVALGIFLWNSRTSPVRAPAPVLASSGGAAGRVGAPLLWAADLEPIRREAPVFRGAATDSREPRPAGSVTSIENGIASIDLGSLDGIASGTAVEFYSGERAIGRGSAVTVFRERARVRIGEGSIRTGAGARPPAEVYLTALFEQADARASRGDFTGARAAAGKAVEWSKRIGSEESRRALELLGSLEYQSGLTAEAEQHYREAASGSNPPATALNTLGVLLALGGDYRAAEQQLRRAATVARGGDPASAMVANNLGVVTEMRGGASQAEALYEKASKEAGSDAGRRAAEANLARLRGSR